MFLNDHVVALDVVFVPLPTVSMLVVVFGRLFYAVFKNLLTSPRSWIDFSLVWRRWLRGDKHLLDCVEVCLLVQLSKRNDWLLLRQLNVKTGRVKSRQPFQL